MEEIIIVNTKQLMNDLVSCLSVVVHYQSPHTKPTVFPLKAFGEQTMFSRGVRVALSVRPMSTKSVLPIQKVICHKYPFFQFQPTYLGTILASFLFF